MTAVPVDDPSQSRAPRASIEDELLPAVRAITSVVAALEPPPKDGAIMQAVRAGVGRGWFRPDEAALIRDRYAVYLTGRDALQSVLDDARRSVLPIVMRGRIGDDDVRRFAVAWTAACMLVRAARTMVEAMGGDECLRRKLDEPDAERRIARRRFRAIRRSLTHPASAWRLSAGLRYADGVRDRVDRLMTEPLLAPLQPLLAASEDAVRMSVRRYFIARARYRIWSIGGRTRSAARNVVFAVLQVGGSVVAELRLPGRTRRLKPSVRQEVEAALQPGDVLITRHEAAVSNLFLPGHWPHAAMYVGGRAALADRGVPIPDATADRWASSATVLEARKDGVRLRAAADTLGVDAVTVLRPRLAAADIDAAIARGLRHEGKLYNFDFDFFTEDRLVCTEVVYRSYDGVGGLSFTLSERSGRPTLSAEDLIRLALDGAGFELVLVAGSAVRGGGVATDERAARRVRATLRHGAGH